MLVLLLSIGSVACTTDELAEATEPIPGAIYKVQFDKINEHLTKNVQDKDANANLAAAKEWLANDLSKNPNEDPNLVKAVELFTSLEKVVEVDSCNAESIEILMNNEAAVGGHVLDDDDQEKDIDRRIEQIFDFYAEKYGFSCLPLDALPGESGYGQKNYYYTTNNYYGRCCGIRLKYHIQKFYARLVNGWRKRVYRYGLKYQNYQPYQPHQPYQPYQPHQPHQPYQHHQPHRPRHGGHGGAVNVRYDKNTGLNLDGRVW